MSLKRHGVGIDCGRCRCASSDGCGGFDVVVPVSDSEADVAGTATLHCSVSPERHQVELGEWHDADLRPVRPSAETEQRILAALGHVAEHRVCGNRKICPAEVVRIVDEHGRR